MAEEKPKEWEQAWTPTKIRQESGDWNLAGDAGLLLYLQQTTSGLMSRFENTKKNMGDLNDEAQKTVVRLDSTINDFSRLANNQFIENRVYDDDSRPKKDSKPKEETTKSKEEREAEAVSLMKSALETGCALLDTHFTKIDVRAMDFDEEDDPSFKPQPLVEPKDPYNNRPLPYIIATADFLKSEYVGLREDEDEIEAKKEEPESESDDDEEVGRSVPVLQTQVRDNAVPLPAPSTSAAKPIVGASSPSVEEKATSDSSGSGLFGSSADSSDNLFPTKAQKVDEHDEVGQVTRNAESDFRSELTKRLAGGAAAAGSTSTVPKEKPKDVTAARPAAPKAPDSDTEDLLFSPPPLLPRQKVDDSDEDERGLFKPRARGLFDDDDEEDKPPPLPRGRLQKLADGDKNTVSKNIPQQTAQSISRDRDSSQSSVSTASIPPVSQVQTTATARAMDSNPKASSLFEDDDDNDDGDLFGKVYKKEPPAPRTVQPILVKPTSDEPPKKSAPPAAAASSRSVIPSSVISAGASLFGDEEDDDDLFEVLKRPKIQAAQKPHSTVAKAVASKSSTNEALARDTTKAKAEEKAEKDEHFTKITPPSESITKPDAQAPPSESLFSRSPSPPLAAPSARSSSSKKEMPPTAKSVGGLFGEDSDEDSLFPAATATKKIEPKNERQEERIPEAKKADFRSELAKKLMAGPQAGGLVKPPNRMLDDNEDDQDVEEPDSVRSVPPSSLFGEDKREKGADDLFKPPAHGLFGKIDNDAIESHQQSDAFDPVSSNVKTLPTLIKNRAKLPNRRPPTKRVSASPSAQNLFDSSAMAIDKSLNTIETVPAGNQGSAEKTSDYRSSVNNADPLGVDVSFASTALKPPPVLESKERSPAPKHQPEEDIFCTTEKTTSTHQPDPIQSTKTTVEEKPYSRSKGASLFENDDENDDDLFGKIGNVATNSRASIKTANVKEEKKPTPTLPSQPTTHVASGNAKPSAKKVGGGLFSDEDDEDLFSDSKKPPKKAVQSAVDEDIFVSKPKPAQTTKPTPVVTESKKAKSLFEDDDDDDIFR